MSGPTVTIPGAQLEALRDRLAIADRILGDLLAPRSWGAFKASLGLARGEVTGVANLLTEAISAAEEFAGPDFEALLYEVLEAVQLQGGRQGDATATRAGVDAALAALRELGPLLAPQAGAVTLAQLRDAVRVQTPVFDLVCRGTANPSTGQRETLVESRTMQCATIPGFGEYIADAEGRSWRVVEVEHRGASVLVTAEGTGWSAIDALEALGADEETRL